MTSIPTLEGPLHGYDGLAAIGRMVNDSLPLPEKLDALAHMVAQVVGADLCLILSVDSGGGHLSLRAASRPTWLLSKRNAQPTFVWGEATNARGDKRTARIKTANGYSLTVTGALAVVEHLLAHEVPGGAYTPATLIGPDLVTRLPGSGPMQIA